MKKIKCLLLTNLVKYVNKFVEKNKKNKKLIFTLYKLNYKEYINQTKKENESNILLKPLNELLSLKINGKKINRNGEWHNKNMIDKILIEEKDNEEIISLLNMTFSQWIDIFLFKSNKLLNDNFKFDLFLSELNNQINKLIDDKNKNIYFTRFMYYLYNYQSFIYLKKGRNRINKNDKTEEKSKK